MRGAVNRPVIDLEDPAVYAAPDLHCDMVMKGGITSGVAYPLAICEVATRYRLHSIGGSSAGALAAAAAAAAEVGRDSPEGGFARLAQLPKRLGEPARWGHGNKLFSLFQPAPTTARYFQLVTELQAAKGRWRKAATAVSALLRGFPRAAALGAIPGMVLVAVLILALRATNAVAGLVVVSATIGMFISTVVALVGATSASAISGVRRARKDISDNYFGVVSGFAPAATDSSSGDDDSQPAPDGGYMPKPLTTWLADELDALAGNTDPARPLTFGDLCDKDVSLKMFTTNLTDGSPYTIPFRNRHFFFERNEFEKLFPPRIVQWLVEHPAAPAPEDKDEFQAMREHDPPLSPLPACDELPVVVATRLSLSFPVLISAIPLWAIPRGRKKERPVEAERCWFSDGGITSNFPIHFFDSPLPRWPTFGLNLGPMTDDQRSDDERENIFSPRSNRGGARPRWTRIDSLGGFARAILDTMQNSADNAQTLIPGYRDRIVLIKHTKDEGGMNLDMPDERITAFSERGRHAGRLLVDRFSAPLSAIPDDELGWENHRWIRFRTFMTMLESTLERYARGYPAAGPGGTRPFEEMWLKSPHYSLTDRQRERIAAITDDLLTLVDEWTPDWAVPASCDCPTPATRRERYDPKHPFRRRSPRPRPALRITPDL